MSSIIVLTGAYGVGKSEVAVQLALLKKPCTIADLDVLNPFFRPRELKEYLKPLGIDVVSSQLDRGLNQDTPSLNLGFMRGLQGNQELIIDCAGSENGLKPLALILEHLTQAQVYLVVNLNRPESSLDQLKGLIEMFERVSQLKITGFIHNTHLLDETTADMILRAQVELEAFSQSVDIPIVYTVMATTFFSECHSKIHNPILKISKWMLRQDWMKGSTL